MRLLDTTIISNLIRNPRGHAAAHLRAVGGASIARSVIVAGELRHGCVKKRSARLSERVEAVLREIEVIAVGPDAAAAYGAIRARLEAAGRTIGQNDLWIAAQAMALSATLVTDSERDFRRVAGLAGENWLAP